MIHCRSMLLFLGTTSFLLAFASPAHAQCGHFRRGDANAGHSG